MSASPPPAPTNSPIVAAFVARTPGSAAAYARARELFPGGVTHDARYVRPHPLTVLRAAGARKWDADGNEYVDYAGGHGALMLGHAHPEIVARVAEQLARGTHHGANHPLEERWGELVRDLVPSAEMVRFTNSGTEATLMALRLARAATGRPKLLRLRGHFHDRLFVRTTTGMLPTPVAEQLGPGLVAFAFAVLDGRERLDEGLNPPGACLGEGDRDTAGVVAEG